MYRIDFWTLWEKARVGCSERIALKHVYYQGWNRSPAQVGCMRQLLSTGALGRPRGMGWGTHINSWLFHVNVWQKPLQYCKVISLQWINISGKKNKEQNKQKKKAQRYIHTPMGTLPLIKEARIYSGEKTISLTSDAGKTGQPLVKEWN